MHARGCLYRPIIKPACDYIYRPLNKPVCDCRHINKPTCMYVIICRPINKSAFDYIYRSKI